MIRSLTLVTALSLFVVFTAFVYAEPVTNSTAKTAEKSARKAGKKVKSGTAVEEKKVYSIDEQYKLRVDKKKRALEIRQKMIQEGQSAP